VQLGEAEIAVVEGGEVGVGAEVGLQAGFRKQIGAALISAAERSGVTPGQLIERLVPDAGVTAVFAQYAVDTDQPDSDVELCSTDRVLFHRTGDRTREPIPPDQIPDLVFSEAMRDVDLFVAVTSIALDPNWADRGDDPHIDYWQAFSFGELTETAAVRRDALARIIPKLKIAGQLQLGSRFLRVRAHLHAYKIHVGSGNIQIEPDDRYLCIVPTGSGRPKVMLPAVQDPKAPPRPRSAAGRQELPSACARARRATARGVLPRFRAITANLAVARPAPNDREHDRGDQTTGPAPR